MLLPFFAPAQHLAAMVIVSLWIWAERLEKARVPGWRVRVPLRALRSAAWAVSEKLAGRLRPDGAKRGAGPVY